MEPKHNPICHIIPPHILRNIAQRGTPAQQASAIRGLLVSAELRSHRQVRSEFTALIETAAAAGKDRAVHDAQEGSSLPGQLVRAENQPPVDDVAVNEAYDGSGITYDLFQEIYGRDSIDGNGSQEPEGCWPALTTLLGLRTGTPRS